MLQLVALQKNSANCVKKISRFIESLVLFLKLISVIILNINILGSIWQLASVSKESTGECLYGRWTKRRNKGHGVS